MPRKAHYIERARGDSQPGRLVVVDADVHQERPGKGPVITESLAGWCAAGWDTAPQRRSGCFRRDGQSAADLWVTWRWCARRPGVTWVVSHRACRLWSLAGLWARLDAGELVLDGYDHHRPGQPRRKKGQPREPFAILEDPPTSLLLRLPGLPGRLLLLDARNWGCTSYPEHLPCAERCRWVLDFVRGMVSTLATNGWGSLRATVASQALYTWRRAFLDHAVLCHSDEGLLLLEREAYVGGRCQAFRVGELPGAVHHLDVSSMYPAHCAREALPCVLEARGCGGPVDQLRYSRPGLGWVAEVALDTDEPAYPATRGPVPTYPVGRFWSVLAGPELADALERSRVRRVGRWARYHLAPVFARYSQAMYTLRLQAETKCDKPTIEWAKRLGACVVGKMGQRGWSWQTRLDLSCGPAWHAWRHWAGRGRVERRRSLAGRVQSECADLAAWDSNLAIAAWVCSLGRLQLLTYLRCAGWDQVYYCDTDSLHVSPLGRQSLVMAGYLGDRGLGRLREVESAGGGRVWGPKHYRLGLRHVCAGLPPPLPGQDRTDPARWYNDGLGAALARGEAPQARLRRFEPQFSVTVPGRLVGPGGVVRAPVVEEW